MNFQRDNIEKNLCGEKALNFGLERNSNCGHGPAKSMWAGYLQWLPTEVIYSGYLQRLSTVVIYRNYLRIQKLSSEAIGSEAIGTEAIVKQLSGGITGLLSTAV